MIQRDDWTVGTQVLSFLHCPECTRAHYLSAFCCSDCGGVLEVKKSERRGTCIAASEVPAKYSIDGFNAHVCLVLLDEGFRVVGLKSSDVGLGDRVVIDFIKTNNGSLRPSVSRAAT